MIGRFYADGPRVMRYGWHADAPVAVCDTEQTAERIARLLNEQENA